MKLVHRLKKEITIICLKTTSRLYFVNVCTLVFEILLNFVVFLYIVPLKSIQSNKYTT